MSDPSKPKGPSRLSIRPFALTLAAIAQLCSSLSLCAQQRDIAVEIYGLTGGYYFGNKAHVLKGGEWNPQIAGGVLVPFGRRWAVMIDGVTSNLEVNEGPHGPHTYHPFSDFYQVNPGVQNNDVTTQRLIAVLPSVVRLWRRDRFSFYAGGGLGLERQSQFIRFQPALPQENPDGSSVLVRSEEFIELRDTVSTVPLILRAGVLVSVAPRIVLRGGYSHILGYVDEFASRSLEVGIGYRF
ncbi:MAG: hypothetical protein OXC19_20150 [Bryobacterales bacterium]|nr:hypothetical protein [Bryobacterales bacterium]